jgi:hypothetical protein
MQRGTVGRTRGFDILYQFGETGGVLCNVVRWVGQGDLNSCFVSGCPNVLVGNCLD